MINVDYGLSQDIEFSLALAIKPIRFHSGMNGLYSGNLPNSSFYINILL